jgi:transcriptional regulator with XRE-family HTH domain
VSDPVKPVCVVLRELREGTGMTQREAARAMGFSAQYVCDVEKGYRKPGRPFVDAVARVCGVDGAALHLLTGRVPDFLVPRDLEAAQELASAMGQSALGRVR